MLGFGLQVVLDEPAGPRGAFDLPPCVALGIQRTIDDRELGAIEQDIDDFSIGGWLAPEVHTGSTGVSDCDG